MPGKNDQHADTTPGSDGVANEYSALTFYSDEFVFNTVSGKFYRLSPTAGYLLHALVRGSSVNQLPALMQEKYGVPEKRAVRDVELFLNDITSLGILDKPLGTLSPRKAK